jgi:hypothetical protein
VSSDNRAVISTDAAVVWTAKPGSGGDRYVAVFNLRDAEQKVQYEWKEIGLAAGGKRGVRDLWELQDLGTADALRVTLGAHGCALFRVGE